MTRPLAPASRDTSRDSSPQGRRCPSCDRPLPSTRARYCSHACRQRAFRLRQPAASSLPSVPDVERALRRRRARAAHTVYECPTCDARFLGERRCAECNTFCRALGLGAACPECDAVLLLADLLQEVLP